jgi:hypothetical protein
MQFREGMEARVAPLVRQSAGNTPKRSTNTMHYRGRLLMPEGCRIRQVPERPPRRAASRPSMYGKPFTDTIRLEPVLRRT